MLKEPGQQVQFYIVSQTWYGRLLAAVVGVLLLLLFFFFFTLFVIIFGLLAIVGTIYMFLFGRNPEKTASTKIIQVEYFLANPREKPGDLDQRQEKFPPGE